MSCIAEKQVIQILSEKYLLSTKLIMYHLLKKIKNVNYVLFAKKCERQVFDTTYNINTILENM